MAGDARILAAERETYTNIWQFDRYANVSPGAQVVPIFQEHATPPATVLDAGCGTGKATAALQAAGFTVAMCDLTDAGLLDTIKGTAPFFQTSLWHDLTPLAYLAHVADERFAAEGFDWVYCCDVLEHLPTQFTGLALSRMLAVAKQGLFLSICHEPDTNGIWLGHPLHLTVQPFVWWRDTLRELGEVVEARDVHPNGLYLVRPR